MTTQSTCCICSGVLGSGTISIFFAQGDVAVCCSRCLVGFALREYESHNDVQLTQARKSLEAARLIVETGGRSEAVIAEVEKARKALWLIDHGKAGQKNGGKPC